MNISTDDEKLWESFSKDIKKLHSQETELEDYYPSSENGKYIKTDNTKIISGFYSDKHDSLKQVQCNNKVIFQPLVIGNLTNIDKNTAERFKKGKMQLEAVIDLHGYKADEAYNSYLAFINKSFQHNKRMLLVITGKGVDGKGVIKQSLPDWSNLAEIRNKILAISPAMPKDGGSGAYYILLRRNR